MRGEAEALGVTLAAAASAYLGALLLAPWLPRSGLIAAAVIAAAALALGWRRAGSPRSVLPVAALGLPLHLAILAGGGLSSPILPLAVPWLALVGALGVFRHAAAAGGIAALLLALGEAWAGELTVAGGLEAGVAVLGGVGLAWVIDRVRRRADLQAGRLNRILEEARAGRGSGGRVVEAARRVDDLLDALERARLALGAFRAVLWDVDGEAGHARPRLASGGEAPSVVALTGDPLRWAWEEALPLRLETPPDWAEGAARACVVPLEPIGGRSALLSLEYGVGSPFPTAKALEDAVGRLRAFLHMQEEMARAVASRERFATMADVLRRLPRELEPTAFARELTESALRLSAATGAAVAVWEQEAGRVLAVAGEDGGPAPGASFGPLESEMALAARQGTTLVRERRRGEGKQLPVAAAGERWHAEPRSLAVVALQDPVHGVVGALAVWRADVVPLDSEAIAALETLSVYAAMQLQQARAYGHLREHAERDALTGLHNRRVFDARLAAEESHYHRYLRPTALALVDIDHFKRINDTYGHEAGDTVLREVSAILRASVRGVDLAARFGGEEFVVLLPETNLVGARDFAERLRRSVEAAEIDWNGQRIPVRISAGISACPECTPGPKMLVASADAALYASKAAGRNRVTAAGAGGVDAGPRID